jgi:putative protease
LAISDGENEIFAVGNIPQEAKNKAVTSDDVIKNITKLGATPYYHTECEIALDEGLFVSAGELNELRRNACEMLDSKRSEIKHLPTEVEFKFANESGNKYKKPQMYIRLESREQIPSDLSGISAVIVPLEKDFELIPDITNIVEIPRGIISEKAIEKRLEAYKQKGFKVALCGNIAAVEIARNMGFEIMADTGLNIFNSYSLETAKALGITSAVASSELLLENINSLGDYLKKGLISYGRIPLMLFKNCPIKNGKGCEECKQNGSITDRKGIEFPIRCRMGYSELLNSVPLWLADKQNLFTAVDFQILYFTNETKDEVCKVISDYKKGNSCSGKYTRGLYFREIM